MIALARTLFVAQCFRLARNANCNNVFEMIMMKPTFAGLVILGEAHLRRILRNYASYYNKIRTHRSLDKDAPAFRSVQRVGTITSYTISGGLHHHYVRV